MATLLGNTTQTKGAQKSVTTKIPLAFRAAVTNSGTPELAEFWTGNTVGTATNYYVLIFEDEAGKPSKKLLASIKGSEAQSKEGKRKASEEAKGEIPPGTSFVWVAIYSTTGTVLIEFAEATAGAKPYKAKNKLETLAELEEKSGEKILWEEVTSGEGTGIMDLIVTGKPSPQGAGVSTAGAKAVMKGEKTEARVGMLANAAAVMRAAAETTGGQRGNLRGTVKAISAFVAGKSAISVGPVVASDAGVMEAAGTDASVLREYYGPAGAKSAEETALAETIAKGNKGPGSRYVEVFYGTPVNKPLVVVLAGGGFVDDQWLEAGGAIGAAEKLASAGFAVFYADYRHASETVGAFPKEVSDVEECVAWARANAVAYGANPNNVWIVGFSAGGSLAMLATERLNATSKVVQGCVSFSGIYDLQSLMEKMENGTFKEAEPQPGGKHSAENLTEHMQFALQQTLTGTPAAELPIIAGKALSNTTASREAQDASSASRQATPQSTKYLIVACETDLIPANQTTLMREKLEAEGRWDSRSSVLIPPESFGHAFRTLWGHKAYGKKGETPSTTCATVTIQFIEGKAEAPLTASAAAKSSAGGIKSASVPMRVSAAASARAAALKEARVQFAAPAATGAQVAFTSTRTGAVQAQAGGTVRAAATSTRVSAFTASAAAQATARFSIHFFRVFAGAAGHLAGGKTTIAASAVFSAAPSASFTGGAEAVAPPLFTVAGSRERYPTVAGSSLLIHTTAGASL